MAQVTILPLDGPFGAQVLNLDLKLSLDEKVKQKLCKAFLDNLVLVIRNQKLTAQEYQDGISIFGEPMLQHNERFRLPDNPFISRIINREKMRPASVWHTDHTNHECPPKCTILFARKLPLKGGDTCFANMYTGLENLTEESRLQVQEMITINHLEQDSEVYSEKDRARYDNGVQQPMVRTHPDTGRKSLYFHITKAQGIIGMKNESVRPFLADLLEQAIKPENTLRHKWKMGDVVIFDNRCVMHRADPNYDMSQERLLWRIILRGDRPH